MHEDPHRRPVPDAERRGSPVATARRAVAARSWSDALSLCGRIVEDEAADARDVLEALWMRRAVHRELGHAVAAASDLERAEHLAERLGDPEALVRALLERPRTPGDPRHLDRAVEVATASATAATLALACLERAAHHLASGDRERARRDLELAAGPAERSTDPLLRARVWLERAELALAEDRPGEALEHVRTGRAVAASAGLTEPLAWKRVEGTALARCGQEDAGDELLRGAADRGDLPAAEERIVVAALADRWEHVRAELRRPGLVERGHPVVVQLARVALAARRRRWSSVAEGLHAARTFTPPGRYRSVVELANVVAELVAHDPELVVAARSLELGAAIGGGLPDVGPRAALAELAASGARPIVGGVRLVERIGGGASGEVWRGVHRSGITVAVKLLAAGASRVARRSMHDELRALAALDHPNIVWLLGHGVLDAAAEAMGLGAIDTPFLVLEHVEGEPLPDLCGRLAWAESRQVLLGVLDGLAHAHARRCLHLDLKPGNLLLGPRVSPRIVDFGLTRRRGDDRRRGVAGTPPYMAPEQIRGEDEALGPWTDLYSLGATAWALVAGRPPFGDHDARGVLEAHLSEPVPSIPADAAAPRGFDRWVRWLMAKRPSDRPRSAAEAHAALAELAESASPAPRRPSAISLAPTALRGLPRFRGTTTPSVAPRPAPRRSPPSSPGSTAPAPRPPLLAEAGVGLLALRRPAMVGRERERALAWSALLGVVGSGRAATLCVTGARGVGGSRFASWLGERAEESGVAQHVAPGGSWIAWLAEDLGVARVQGPERAARLAGRVPDPAERDLLEEAFEGGDLPAAAVRGLVARHLARRSTEAPQVVVLDPAAEPELALASDLVELAVPLLVVVVGEAGHGQRLELCPLPDEEVAALLDRWLPLDASLRADLVARSAGRPAVARELILGLTTAGDLSPYPGGWRLARGRSVSAGADPRWSRRVVASGAAPLIELCSVLGEATEAEIAEVAARAGVEVSAVAFDRAVASGLLDRAGSALRVVPAAADAVIAELDPERSMHLHEACAAVLSAPSRRARHLRRAGRPREALRAIERAQVEAMDRWDYVAVRDWLAEWEAALREAGVPIDHPDGLALDVARGQEARARGDLDGMQAALDRIDALGRGRGGTLASSSGSFLASDAALPLAGSAAGRSLPVLLLRADLAQRRMQRGKARELFREGLVLGRRDGDPRVVSKLLSRLSFAALLDGDDGESRRLAEEALAHDDRGVDLWCLLSTLCLRSGDREGALGALHRAGLATRRTSELADVLAARAMVLVHDGAFSEAADRLLEAAARKELLGLFRGVLVGNAALCLFVAGRDEEALATMARLRGRTLPSERVLLVATELIRAAGEPGDAWRAWLDELLASPHLEHVRASTRTAALRRAVGAGRPERAELLDGSLGPESRR